MSNNPNNPDQVQEETNDLPVMPAPETPKPETDEDEDLDSE